MCSRRTLSVSDPCRRRRLSRILAAALHEAARPWRAIWAPEFDPPKMGRLSGPERHLVPEVGEPAPGGVQQPLGVEPVEALGAEVSLADAVAQNVGRRDEAFPAALAAYG